MSDLVGRNFNSECKDLRVIFEFESTRPLVLQSIESRFLRGTYGDSHEAFLEDAMEVKYSLLVSYFIQVSFPWFFHVSAF